MNRKNQSGQALFLFVLVIPIFLALMSLAIDVGRMGAATGEFQTSVDAAALSGGRTMLSATATDTSVKTSVGGLRNSVAGTANQNATFGTSFVDFGTYNFTTKTFTTATFTTANAIRVSANLEPAAGKFPLTFANLFGYASFNPQRAAIVAISGPSFKKATFPMAVSASWFQGILRSGTIHIRLDPSTNNTMWSGFTSTANDNNARDFISDPSSIPTLSYGTPINVVNGTMNSAFSETAKDYKVGDTLFVAVADLSATPTPILGFAAFKLTAVSSGKNKFIEGDLIPFDDNGNDQTMAQCFGLDCRPMLVQ